MMRIVALWFLLACAPLLVVGSSSCIYTVPSYEVLEDKGGTLTIQQALQSAGYATAPQLNFGYTPSAFWVRFALPAQCNGNGIYVVSDYRCLDYLDFYVVRNGQVTKQLATGYLRKLSTREKPYSRFVMQLPQGWQPTDTLYVRMQKYEGMLRTAFTVMDEATVLSENNTEWQIFFFFLGVCFIICVFALSYYITFRLSMFLWYIGFIASFALNQVFNYGYGPLYLWGDLPWWSSVSRVVTNPPAILACLMFCRSLLKVDDFCPEWVNKAFNFFIYLMLAELVMPFLPLPPYPWRFALFAIHNLAVVGVLLLVVYAAWRAIRNRHLPGYFFMAGEVVLLCVVVLMVMRNFRILPLNFLGDFTHLYVGIGAMALALISMLSYTRSMHITVVQHFVPEPLKATPRELTPDELEKLDGVFEAVEKLMSTDKPYLKDNFNLSALAEQTGIAEHLLSKAINTKADMHFFDFVNSYRIREATRLLADEEAVKKYTLEALAETCGFSNRTSFNKAFKKFTGETPSGYRQKNGAKA